MLVGREAECSRIDRLLEGARGGRSGVLLVRGESGIGKSVLLEYALDRARGMTVVSTRGVESEFEIPFAGLHDFVRPLLPLLDSIPQPQAAALQGAFALGPPATGDRFAVPAAMLSLLGAAAETEPLLAVVDDAQWLDAASAEALLFAARRLEEEGVGLIFAVRDAEPTVFEEARDLDELRVTGLDRRASEALLLHCSTSVIAARVIDHLFSATGGNPLALVEAAVELSDAQLTGAETLPDPVSAPESIERAYLGRVARLPDGVRRALIVAAAAGSESVEVIAIASGGREHLEAAETGDLISIDEGTIRFRHPLLRSAVYHGAAPVERRAAHQALADALSGDDYADRRAWHVAAAAVGPDESVAEALERAARSALSRLGYVEACAAFERAAEFSIAVDRRAERRLMAAEAAYLSGAFEQAHGLLSEALKDARYPVLRAKILHRQGILDVWSGRVHEGRRILTAGAATIASSDPQQAFAMLINAVTPCLMALDMDGALDLARNADGVGRRLGPEGALGTGMLAYTVYLRGDEREATRLLDEVTEHLENAPALPNHIQVHVIVWYLLIGLGRYADAGRHLDAAIEAARSISAPSLLPVMLAFRGELDYHTGAWAGALADGSESIRLAAETGQHGQVAHSMATLARVEAAQGKEVQCREHCETSLDIARDFGIDTLILFARPPLGLLELGLGRPTDAITHLEPVWQLLQERSCNEIAIVPWLPDLVESYIRAGRTEDAARTLERLDERILTSESTWARVAAGRCHGLIAGDDAFEGIFVDALTENNGSIPPFERARTHLCFGERLRRARRPSDAREQLHHAITAFEHLGAAPWAARAHAELEASGERAARHEPSDIEELTARELQVGMMIATGATNREAAASLFVTPKTIEAHLGRVYRKLGVRSRAELAALLARERPEDVGGSVMGVEDEVPIVTA